MFLMPAENFVRIGYDITLSLREDNSTVLLKAISDSATERSSEILPASIGQVGQRSSSYVWSIVKFVLDPAHTKMKSLLLQEIRQSMTMSIEDKRDQLVEELIPFEDHLERLTYVIDRAKDNPGLEAEYKINTFLIKGCVSSYGSFPVFHEGKCFFRLIPEASITKGTASLLCDLYSGESPADIVRLWFSISYRR